MESLGTNISHYNILRRIGAGGMGEVYLAEDTLLHRNVAIKFLPSRLTADDVARRRLVREARAAAALDHPNICTIHEVGEADGRTFIVMQYVEGEDLAARLGRGRLATGEALDIAIQIAEALAEAHSRGIVHRDIKPQNIMLTARSRVKILDFGLAKILNDGILGHHAETQSLLTGPGAIVGTLNYMSPEQVRCEPLDERSDIFSFGAVLFEMISGGRLFGGQSAADVITAILTGEPPRLDPDQTTVPTGLEQIVLRCLEKHRDHRYRSMHEVAADLEKTREECAGGTTANGVSLNAQTRRMTVEHEDSRRPGRWASPLVLVPAALLILAAVGYVLFFKMPQSAPPSATRQINREAYDLYIRGRVKVGSDNRDDNETAIKLLEQAVAIDPNYAEAYAALARAYNTKSFFLASESEKKQLNDDAEVAVAKALALDPKLAEGHFARGLILWTPQKRFPHEQVIQAYKRALELNPNLDDAHQRLGVVYSHVGLLDEAQEEARKAVEINPNNTLARFRIGEFDMYEGKYAEGLDNFKTIPRDVSPSLVDGFTALALFRLGRFGEASAVVEDHLETHPQDEGGNVTSVKAIVFAKAGKRREAEETIGRAIEIGKGLGHFHHADYNIAVAYALLNESDEAVKWLQAAADDGFPCYPFFDIDDNFDNIRNNPQFITLMARLRSQWERYKTEYTTS
jgi:serine/threonine protein kinase/tetratricopeptide (TPR) repeat protein